MIGVRIQIVIEEHAVAALTRLLLQGQRDQVAESTLGQRVLIRKEAVVRIEADVGPALHRFRKNQRAELSRQCSREGLFEEEPHVRAGSRARTFQSARQIHMAAGRDKSGRVLPPALLVEIGGEEETRLVLEHRVDAPHERLSGIITT